MLWVDSLPHCLPTWKLKVSPFQRCNSMLDIIIAIVMPLKLPRIVMEIIMIAYVVSIVIIMVIIVISGDGGVISIERGPTTTEIRTSL